MPGALPTPWIGGYEMGGATIGIGGMPGTPGIGGIPGGKPIGGGIIANGDHGGIALDTGATGEFIIGIDWAWLTADSFAAAAAAAAAAATARYRGINDLRSSKEMSSSG
jgi:hypothetical protein